MLRLSHWLPWLGLGWWSTTITNKGQDPKSTNTQSSSYHLMLIAVAAHKKSSSLTKYHLWSGSVGVIL